MLPWRSNYGCYWYTDARETKHPPIGPPKISQVSYLDLHRLFVIDLVHPLFVAQGRGPQLLGPRHGGTAASTSDSVVLFGGSAVARPSIFFWGGKMCLDRSERLSQTR